MPSGSRGRPWTCPGAFPDLAPSLPSVAEGPQDHRIIQRYPGPCPNFVAEALRVARVMDQLLVVPRRKHREHQVDDLIAELIRVAFEPDRAKVRGEAHEQ